MSGRLTSGPRIHRLRIYPFAQTFHPSPELCLGRIRKRRFERVPHGRPLRGWRGQVRRVRGGPGEYPEPRSSDFRKVRSKRFRRKLFRFESGGETGQLGGGKV